MNIAFHKTATSCCMSLSTGHDDSLTDDLTQKGETGCHVLSDTNSLLDKLNVRLNNP